MLWSVVQGFKHRVSPSCTNVFSLYSHDGVAFIHMMEDDQRLYTLVHEGDALHVGYCLRRIQKFRSTEA